MDAWTKVPLARFIADGCTVDYEAYSEEIKLKIREIGVRNMLINRRLCLLLEKLQERNVPAIVLKGCHLMQDLYPFGIRPIEDIDILLQREHFTVIDEIVREMGYEDTVFALDVWTHLKIANKISYINHTKPIIPLDVHFTLGPYPYLGRISFEDLLNNSQRITVNGIEFLVLGPEMLFVHLCLHLFQHHGEHWEVSAYDLIALTTLRQHTFNWSLFLSIVKKHSLQLPVQYSLKKAAKIAEVCIPPAIGKEIESMPVSRRERRVFRGCLTLMKVSEKYLMQFLTLPGLKLKIQCLLRIVFPSKVFLRHYYNGSYLKYLLNGCQAVLKFLRA